MYAKAQGEVKDVILLHGGNDSYFEEFFFPMLYLASQGFDIYLLRTWSRWSDAFAGKHFTYQWERPVKTILDYFHLENITIVGASLGGFLAPRAAAFENELNAW